MYIFLSVPEQMPHPGPGAFFLGIGKMDLQGEKGEE
jgi:hypothetical protein